MYPRFSSALEYRIFLPAVLLLVCAAILMLLLPDTSHRFIQQLFHVLTHRFGWAYLLMALVLMAVSLWIACSRYGDIKLGEADEKKEFSDWTWVTMLFTTSMGISVILLGFMDPISLLTDPPLHAAPMSQEAYQYAHMYSQFVEGPMAWAIYGPITAAVAYTIHVKRVPALRLSSVCLTAFPCPTARRAGEVLDILVILGMVCGVSTSLGLGTPTVVAFLEYLTGLQESVWMTVGILLVWALIFGTSVYLGLERGIRRLNHMNIVLLLVLMALVLTRIPLNDLLFFEMGSLGAIFDHLGALTLGSPWDRESFFTQNWTIFYWAWWFAFTPIVALFGAKISRGRTLRQLILGQIVYGGGGSMLVYALFGGYALYLQSSGRLDLVALAAGDGRERALISILETLPFGRATVFGTLCLIFIFLATTIDSTAYTLASASLRVLPALAHPPRWTRMLWAVILLFFSLGLITIGGLQTAQTASLALGFPLIFVLCMVLLCFIRMLRTHSTPE